MTQDYNVSVSMNQAAVVKTGLVMKQGDFGFNLKITVLDFDTSNTTPQIVFRKPMGAVESTSITKSDNVYTYVMQGTELDTPGKVYCDLKLKNSTTQRISTASFSFECVADTLDGLNEHANSYSDTIGQIWQTLEDYSDDSEAWAKGTKGGTPVADTDDQYHNNAKYYSEISKSSSEDSEAWAVGTKDGTPVGSSAPQYENNSKYYSDLCASETGALAQEVEETNESIITVRGIIPYNGGQQTINADANADKTKYYYVSSSANPNYKKIMYYNTFAGEWQYYGLSTIDDAKTFEGLEKLEFDNVLKNITEGYKSFPTAYAGGLGAISVDENADKTKYYYVDISGGSANNGRILFYNYHTNNWQYAGDYTIKNILELGTVWDFSFGILPYRGGLTAINGDTSVDTSKKYFCSVSSYSAYLRVMEYDSTNQVWVYNGKIFSLEYFINKALGSMFGVIPYNGDATLLNADSNADKTKRYINLAPGSNTYMRILQYSYSYNQWIVANEARGSYEDILSNLIGATPYWAGGKGTINSDPGADTSKEYFIANPGDNQYKKMKYDAANSTWDYNGRISPNLFDTFIELYSQMLGIIPYYGGLTDINANPFVDTSKKYFVALATSAHYLETMTYKPLSSAWAYGDKIPTLDAVAAHSATSVNIENSKVKAYLDNTIYDGSDYSYTNVLDYAANDYDYPNGETVEWDYSGTCDSFNVKVALDGDFSRSYTYSVANNVRSFELKNLNPTKAAGVKVSAVSGTTETVILSQAIHATGQERMIKVDGIRNVRDIGGWDCEGGKIKYGKIFRGSAIDESGSTITENGKIVLYNLLGVRSEIDLRSTASPSTSDLGPDATRYRISGYSYLNGYNNTTDAYNVLSRVFTEVAAGNIIYIHCSGGCDRTAFYICMIEGLLGASEDDINKDYELSSFMDQAYSNNYRRYRNMGETYSNRDWAGLIGLIKAGTGNTWQEKFYNYFIGIGFTAEEIIAFKNAMISK